MSKKDFRMRVKISKKEVKESRFWLILTKPLKEQQREKEYLIQEATELMKIFGSILENQMKFIMFVICNLEFVICLEFRN